MKFLNKLFGAPDFSNPEKNSFNKKLEENKIAVARSIQKSRSLVLLNDLMNDSASKEALIYSLFVSSPDLICIASNMTFYLVSPSFTRLLGWSEKDLLCSDCICKFVHFNDINRLKAILSGKEPAPVVIKLRMLTSDNQYKWVEWSINSSQTNDQYYMIGRDISDIVEISGNLYESEEKFSAAFNDAAIGMALVNLDGKITKANKTLCKLLGYTSDELMDINYVSLIVSEDAVLRHEQVLKLMSGELDHYHMRKRFICKNGEILWVYASISAVHDDNNNVLYLLSQIQDITPLIKTNEALSITINRLQIILDNVIDGIVTINQDGIIIYPVNSAAAKMFGYAHDELVGQSVSILMPEEYKYAHQAAINRYIKSGHSQYVIGKTRLVRGKRKDGTEFPVEISVGNAIIEGKHIFTAILRDTSDREV